MMVFPPPSTCVLYPSNLFAAHLLVLVVSCRIYFFCASECGALVLAVFLLGWFLLLIATSVLLLWLHCLVALCTDSIYNIPTVLFVAQNPSLNSVSQVNVITSNIVGLSLKCQLYMSGMMYLYSQVLTYKWLL